MEIFTSLATLKHAIAEHKKTGQKIGFVPTMGALHEGHLSLIQEAKPLVDLVVCSIFVNPTQFNNPEDLEKYPRPVEQDIALLESVDCNVLFLPEVDDLYPADDTSPWGIDLKGLDGIWEGEHRPGHFQGVTQVVYKLFQGVQPDIAFFGQKDFQQVMVIRHMINTLRIPVSLHVVPTRRDERGLALSSRNVRLSPSGIEKAYAISKALRHIRSQAKTQPLDLLVQEAMNVIHQEEGLKVEYLAVCETETLKPVSVIVDGKDYVILVAAWLEGIRLIDNMLL